MFFPAALTQRNTVSKSSGSIVSVLKYILKLDCFCGKRVNKLSFHLRLLIKTYSEQLNATPEIVSVVQLRRIHAPEGISSSTTVAITVFTNPRLKPKPNTGSSLTLMTLREKLN